VNKDRKTVLVVEDNSEDAALIQVAFRKADFEDPVLLSSLSVLSVPSCEKSVFRFLLYTFSLAPFQLVSLLAFYDTSR
jgi:hypothetical protein